MFSLFLASTGAKNLLHLISLPVSSEVSSKNMRDLCIAARSVQTIHGEYSVLTQHLPRLGASEFLVMRYLQAHEHPDTQAHSGTQK